MIEILQLQIQHIAMPTCLEGERGGGRRREEGREAFL